MSLAERMQVQTIHFLKAFNVFNVDQTNLAEVKPDKVEALKSCLPHRSCVMPRDVYQHGSRPYVWETGVVLSYPI
jgi:hypothetical protein